jgi:hypothetical protein
MKQRLRQAVMIGVLTVFVMSLLVGCTTHEHIVGTGAATGYTESAKQWYLLWGLMAINDVNTNVLSGGAENYKIITQTSIIDALITSLTGGILSVRTVKVIK